MPGKGKGGVKPVNAAKLEEIAAKLLEKTGIQSHVIAREAQPV
jgi:hypothetical protein